MKRDRPGGPLISELGKRGVYQAVGIYVAVAWGIIEILITVADRFGWPAWLGDAALILFLTGLPFVVLLAWAFDLTGHGLERVEPGTLKGKTLIAGGLTFMFAVSATFFTLREPGTAQNEPAAQAAFRNHPGHPTIAVLPFDQYLGTEQGELLARNFTDETINRINQHPDLAALDWNTVNNPLLAELISAEGVKEPSVDYLVHGSLRPAPVGVELSVRMTDPQGAVLWEYEAVRKLNDPQEARIAQRFVAGQIAAGVGTSLTGLNYCELSENPEALALYYEAQDLFGLRDKSVAAAAIRLEEAIELDPDFARAMDLLANVYQRFAVHLNQQPETYRGMSLEQLYQWWQREKPAATVAKAALDRCPSLGSAYVSVELSAPVEHTLADDFEFHMEGLRRDPGNVNLMDRMVYLSMFHGQLERAHEYASRFQAHDPLSPRSNRLLSLTERLRGDYQQALESIHRAVDLGYNPQYGYHHIAYLLMVLDERDALIVHLGPDFRVSTNDEPNTLFYDPVAFLDARGDPALREQLSAELTTIVEQSPPPALAGGIIGWNGGNPVGLELGDERLTWKALRRLVVEAPQMLPESLWDHRYRHRFGARLMVLEPWREQFSEFWKRHGPPDGCSWDEKKLDCEWADETSRQDG